ncbi:MAG TPA: hypothetical protein VJP89_00805, partial [Pyrinomonadaceae bacterium]|nr:hypothetical protein [Pyrinomonadaceae bacterium]
TPVVPSNNNGLTFVATLTNPFPNGLSGVQPSFGSSLGLLTGFGADVAADTAPIIGPQRKNSKFARFVFGIQRELPGQIVVEANFIRANGYDLAVSRNLNFVPRQFVGDNPVSDAAANTFLSVTIPNPFRNLVPGGSALNTATTITRAQSLLTFPQFNNLWVQEYNGTNRYNSLQLQIDKRFATDVSLTATYTWSNLREKVSYLNAGDTLLEDRISQFDRPHRFTFAGVYELPIGRGRKFGNNMNRVLDAFIGGWQLNGTYEWQSGEPFLLTGNNLFFPGDVSSIKSRLGDGDGQGGKFGIDRSAIDAPGLVTLTAFGLRNVPTTLESLRNQPYSVANVGLTKNFKMGEGRRLQLRAEALNALNHPYFGAGMGLNPGTAAAPNAAFGLVTTQRNNPRDIQFGAKFVF